MVHQIDQYSNEWKKYTAKYNGNNPAKNMTLYDWALLSRCVDEQTLNAGPEVIRTCPFDDGTTQMLIALLSDAALNYVFGFRPNHELPRMKESNRGIRQWLIAIIIQIENETIGDFGAMSIVDVKKILGLPTYEWFFGKYDPKPHVQSPLFFRLNADFLCAYKSQSMHRPPENTPIMANLNYLTAFRSSPWALVTTVTSLCIC